MPSRPMREPHSSPRAPDAARVANLGEGARTARLSRLRNLWRVVRAHLIGEVPITFVNRTEGASKISKVEIYKDFYTLVRLRTSALPWDRMVDLYHRRRVKAED